MNLRELEYIVSVAELGHFGQAAKACHVSQPTLSGQIRKLEEELGVTLFERGRGGVRVTEAGRAIIEEAQRALSAAEEIRSIARAAQDPLSGHFRLGLIPTVAPYLIPRFVARLSEALPNVSMVYSEDITDRLTDDLIAGRIDGAILATPPETDALLSLPLYNEPFRMVVPDGHDLTTLTELKMSDVDNGEVLLLTEGHCFRDQALSICETREQRQQHSLRATSLETLINLVAQGQGVTLVPVLAAPRLSDDRGLTIRYLDDPGAAREVNLMIRKSFSRRELADRIATIIREGLPDTVQRLS